MPRPTARSRLLKAEPHAFAASGLADPVHAVVPVPRPHQRERVASHRQTVVERPRAMFGERATLGGGIGQEEPVVLVGGERVAGQEPTGSFSAAASPVAAT